MFIYFLLIILQQCRFDLIVRPKTFDVLVLYLNEFFANEENVENLWKYVLENQHKIENQQQYNSEL